jgi:hypothetical protein
MHTPLESDSLGAQNMQDYICHYSTFIADEISVLQEGVAEMRGTGAAQAWGGWSRRGETENAARLGN